MNMALRAILAAASGGTASNGAIELGCRLARRFGAHLECFHVQTDPREIIMWASEGFGMPVAGDWIDRFTEDVEKQAKKTRTAALAAVARHGIPIVEKPPRSEASAAWREEVGYAPVRVAQRARFFDLTVLGRSERVADGPHSDTIEETLIASGRPVLLAPAKVPTALGDSIALGWNGSPEAVHVLGGALPLLAAAREVTVVTVGDEPAETAPAALEYLAWHGVVAKHRRILPVHGVGPGEQLLSEAREAGADLLVMGGYGHRPWRELLFGGATRQVVGTSLLPVLIAH
jgi:nucleotide-binding universal stress UspA family protein